MLIVSSIHFEGLKSSKFPRGGECPPPLNEALTVIANNQLASSPSSPLEKSKNINGGEPNIFFHVISLT